MNIQHHGIKGQQWGVHRGPPYPIQKGHGVRIDKGTKFKRISRYDESNAEGHAYVNWNKRDAERYKGFFGAMIAPQAVLEGRKVYVHELEAAKDLRSPSQQERIDIFMEMYKNDPVIRSELAKYHKHGEQNAHAYLPQFWYNYQYQHLNDDKARTKGYDTFVRSIGGNEYTRSKYFQELQRRGYDFIRDDQDAGVRGQDPSIIIDRKSATIFRNSKELTMKEIRKNIREYGTFVDKDQRHRSWES